VAIQVDDIKLDGWLLKEIYVVKGNKCCPVKEHQILENIKL
jgi:hypothetical protein